MKETAVIITSLLMFGLCCWLEIRRAGKQRLMWRLLASLLLIAGLAGLVLEPKYTTKISGKKGIAVLLTEGFEADSLAHFGTGAKLYTTDAELARKNPLLKIRPVYEASDLPPAAELHVLGHGLNEAELAVLKNRRMVFHPVKWAQGIIAVNWPQSIRQGEMLDVAGRYANNSAAPVKMVMEGFGIRLDSQLILPHKTQRFQLKSSPRILGRGVYRIITFSGKDTLENASVPFQVQPKHMLKVLMLASAPGFENRFVKNWLAGENYGLALRSTISKGKITQEFVNLPQFSLQRIQPALLQKFDVLLADAAALKAISAGESSAIRSAVEKNGLGLVLRTDTATALPAWFAANFRLATGKTAAKQEQLFLPGGNGRLAMGTSALFIRPVSAIRPLVLNTSTQMKAAAAITGRGKVILSTLGETYPLIISGDKKGYGNLWTRLIGEAAPRRGEGKQMWAEPKITRQNEHGRIWLMESGGIPQVFAGPARVAMAQSIQIPYRWHGNFWPQKPGWQFFRTGRDSSWLYFFDRNEWPGVRAAEQIASTEKHLLNRHDNVSESIDQKISGKKSVPPLFFFLICLFCWAFLWIERKI